MLKMSNMNPNIRVTGAGCGHVSRVTCHALVHVPAVLVTAQDNKVRLELVLASSNK